MDGSAAQHIPVLAEVLVEQIKLPQDAVVVDATIGQGGHSLLFGKRLGPKGAIIGLDVDINAIRRAQSVLEGLLCRVILVNSNFSEIAEVVRGQGMEKVDFILADLGFCSAQLEDDRMGLSFQRNMPLDMRLDKRLKTTAADIINRADEKTLADLIYKFGEERASRRIARFIVERRHREPITTTGQLAAIILSTMGKGGQWSRIHPATRTFQALRIAVNNELENLEALLGSAPALLEANGYIAVISFHSLEDRIVKTNFKSNEKNGVYKVITKKPISASRDEISENHRARSAKLRIAQKV
ncbi:MAG: 16S rRNA (cytosine(1402)-N(4))-methyltransferase RsmH [Sedimentisphaerales bacterium]